MRVAIFNIFNHELLGSPLCFCGGTELTSLAQARSVLAAWRHDNYHHRPHSSLGNMTPASRSNQLNPSYECR